MLGDAAAGLGEPDTTLLDEAQAGLQIYAIAFSPDGETLAVDTVGWAP